MTDYPREPVLDTTRAKRQHSVPRLLFRNFCVDGKLDVYELQAGRAFSTSPNNVGVEAGYYDVQSGKQELSAEAWLSEVEGAASSVFSKVTYDVSSFLSLTHQEENDFARFVCAQDFRTHAFRDLGRRIRQQLVDQLKDAGRRRLYATEAREDADHIWDAWKDKPDEWFLNESEPYQPARSVAGMLAGVQGFANLLLAMPWRLGRVSTPPGIYLGDNPVVRRELTAVPFAGYPEHTYYLPLSPDLLFSAGPHLSGSLIGPRQIVQFSEWETSIVRHLSTARAARHLFGTGPYVSRECAEICLARLGEEDWRLTFKTRQLPGIGP